MTSNKLRKLAIVIIIAFIGFVEIQFSSDPPLDYTNRKGQNCTHCHQGTLNNPLGSFTMQTDSVYYPGRTYTLNTAQNGGVVYGFEITAVLASDIDSGAGNFIGTGYTILTDSSRPYVRHGFASFNTTQRISWIAPSSNVGIVNFYGAGVSADGDFGNDNDFTNVDFTTMKGLDRISFDIDSILPSCPNGKDGRIRIRNAAGGAGAPYGFEWSNSNSTFDSISNLQDGIYSVTVYDKDSNSESASVQLLNLKTSFTNKNLSCFNDSSGSLSVKVTKGVRPYSYSWSNGVKDSVTNNLKANQYYRVTASDSNGCSTLDSFMLTQPQPLKIDSIYQTTLNDNLCDEEASISVSGGTPKYNYSWSNGGTNPNLIDLCAGTYTCTITDSNGCVVNRSLDINDRDITSSPEYATVDLKVYPNPVSDVISITYVGQIVSVKLLDLNGAIVWRKEATDIVSINCSHLEKGTYVLLLEAASGERFRKKINVR